ncbi:MAG: IPExxxVDY family protein [Cyclobacteriaceae bacterium]
MKKKTLDISYSYDFDLLGIISPLKGYKMAWEINNCLNIKLVKDKDLCISFKKGIDQNFSQFSYSCEAWVLKLFRNKPLESDLSKVTLVPEFPHFDFVLLTQSDDPAKSNRLQEVLRLIPSVELVAFIPLGALKAKDYFIF